MSFTTKDYHVGKINLEKGTKQDTLKSAYKFLARIVDNNDLSSVPFIAAIADAYYSGNKAKIVEYLKEIKNVVDRFINDLEQ